MSPLRFWVSVLGVGGAIIAIGCDKDPARDDALFCERAYAVCPSFSPASKEDATECARVIDGPCGTTMRQYLRCVAGKCDDAGAIDFGVAESSCGVFLDAYRDCTKSDADADACVADASACDVDASEPG